MNIVDVNTGFQTKSLQRYKIDSVLCWEKRFFSKPSPDGVTIELTTIFHANED